MTVAELRKALEGVPDDMTVHVRDETWTTIPAEANVQPIWMTEGELLGDGLDSNFPGWEREPILCFYIR